MDQNKETTGKIWLPPSYRKKSFNAKVNEWRNKKYESECLAPVLPKCEGKSVGCHSVSKSSVLDILKAPNNHVIMFKQKYDLEERDFRGSEIGINKATTFSGLCTKHDNEIFKPIDTGDSVKMSQEQKFLFLIEAY
jgi:hypothetical protein